jgi:hypothetical protein
MDPLTIALAIYGGYQGYKSAKRSHASTLGTLFSTAAGAYGGYSLGSGIGSLTNAGANAATNIGVGETINAGVNSGIGAFGANPYGMVDPYAGTSLGMEANQFLPQVTNQIPVGDAARGIGSYGPQFQQIQPTITNAAYTVPSGGASNYGLEQMPDGSWSYTQAQVQPQVQSAAFDTKGYSILDSEANNQKLAQQLEADKLAEMYKYDAQKTGTQIAKSDAARGVRLPDDYSALETSVQRQGTPTKSFSDQALEMAKKTFYDDEKGIKLGNAALVGVPAALYASGAFERKPYERSMFTYNVNYPDLYRNRKFYTQDPKTGEVIEMPQQDYIPEERADVQEGSKFGPYKRETITLQQGGLATLNHFKDGGVNYLPSKTIADEDNEDNYMRVNGYVEDGAGNGDKEEDTMLAQLADGEFVTRTDGVLGAGILAGASPKNAKEMRKLGAEFFYEQQKRFKRIYDLLDASRKATAH